MMPSELPAPLLAALSEEHQAKLAPLVAKAEEQGFAWLEVHFASLPRKLGKARLKGEVVTFSAPTYAVDLGGLSVADVGAVAVLLAARLDDASLKKLFAQGDQEERRMILRALPHLGDRPLREALLTDTHRANDVLLFEAAFCDRRLPAAILSDLDYQNVILKAAFLDLAVARLLGWEERVSPDLTSKLLDFMDERNAAGRRIWGPSLEVCALAPVPGLADRVLVELQAEAPRRRLAAARAAAILAHPELQAAAGQRVGGESDPTVREALEAAAPR